MKTSESIGELAAALAKAQGEIEGAQKDSANPFFKSKYADLASIWDACRVPLTKNGLAVIQFPKAEGNAVSVETRLVHSSGQWVEDCLTATAKDEGPQSIGSTVTYLRRYSLQSIVGVAPEDDDGNAGQDQSHHPSRKPATKAEKIAAEHGMTTGDKIKPPASFDSTLAKVPTLESLDRLKKALAWVEGELVAKHVTADQAETFCLALAERAIDLCNDLPDYEQSDKLIRDMGGKMRIRDAKASELRIKLSDAKDAKLGAAA